MGEHICIKLWELKFELVGASYHVNNFAHRLDEWRDYPSSAGMSQPTEDSTSSYEYSTVAHFSLYLRTALM